MQRLRKNQFQLSEQQERARYLLIEQLKKDPLVHRFIQSHNLPLHIVEKKRLSVCGLYRNDPEMSRLSRNPDVRTADPWSIPVARCR